jgi:hypothetical protein
VIHADLKNPDYLARQQFLQDSEGWNREQIEDFSTPLPGRSYITAGASTGCLVKSASRHSTTLNFNSRYGRKS